MLAADTAFEIRTGLTAFLDSVVDELADCLGVEGLERIGVKNLVAEVVSHKCSDIVA